MWSIGGTKRGAEPEKWLAEAMQAIVGEKGEGDMCYRCAGLDSEREMCRIQYSINISNSQ